MALAATPTDPLAVDVLFPGGQLLFSARGAAIRVAGAWPPLRRLAPPTSSSGADAIGADYSHSAPLRNRRKSLVGDCRETLAPPADRLPWNMHCISSS